MRGRILEEKLDCALSELSISLHVVGKSEEGIKRDALASSL